MNVTIGTCSICGGAVVVPQAWCGINPPTPRCSGCGATPVQSHGPIIPMKTEKPKSKSWQVAKCGSVTSVISSDLFPETLQWLNAR